MIKTLAKFTIKPIGDDYRVHIEDSDGLALDFVATFDQLDDLGEEIDRNLDRDEDNERSID